VGDIAARPATRNPVARFAHQLALPSGRAAVAVAAWGVQINLWMHILGSAAVVAIVVLPVAHDWVTRRL
jgi:hypothetical protein